MRWPDFKTPAVLIFLCSSLMMAGMCEAVPTSTTSSPIPNATEAAPATNLPVVPASTNSIDIPVVKGVPVKGIKIPQYDESGKLTMCLTADNALKLNDRQVEFGNLKVQFDDKQEKEIVVEIPHSVLNLYTKMLSADSKTVIHREDFAIEGESAEFDTIAKKGTFKGHVHASFLNQEPIVQQ